MARYEIQVVNGEPICWDNELNIGVGDVETCRRYQQLNSNRASSSKYQNKPIQYVAQSRFIRFSGIDEKNMKRNLIYLGSAALGGYIGMKFIKFQSKAVGAVAGIGIGLITGIILNKTLNK